MFLRLNFVNNMIKEFFFTQLIALVLQTVGKKIAKRKLRALHLDQLVKNLPTLQWLNISVARKSW